MSGKHGETEMPVMAGKFLQFDDFGFHLASKEGATHELKIKRTDEELAAIREVSDCIRSLSLKAKDNNALVEKMTRMVNVVEREQFMSGAVMAASICKETSDRR
jgi:hypothetical protein